MFRTLRKFLLPNPFDRMLDKCAKRGGKKILLAWNRGLGDIALGLYAMIHRIRQKVPHAEITFLTRENLKDGFSLLRNIEVLIDPDWKRGEKVSVANSLKKLGISIRSFDLVIERPSPTDWVPWQRGKVTPKLAWDPSYDALWEKFGLDPGFEYIGVQAVVETSYGVWRNWPLPFWNLLFTRLSYIPNVKVILLGSDDKTEFEGGHIIDLRGKTTLFEMLSILKHRCSQVVLPDSGILSMIYYLDQEFPVHVVSLWADPKHGILKQAVASPNPKLIHTPMIGKARDLSTVSVQKMMNALFPARPLKECPKSIDIVPSGSLEGVGCILLAGGQGSRLGIQGPKGTFPLLGKSLFQWICEKIPNETIPIAVMTSPENHNETVQFFKEHQNFQKQVYFFPQETLPFLDDKKLETPHLVPNGNGSVFKSFKKAGLDVIFQEKGIELLSIVPIENPLADPVDPFFLEYAKTSKSDAVIKCVLRESQNESMGALVERNGRIEIVEYIDLDPALKYVYSNTGMLAFSYSFFQKMFDRDLPLHLVQKKIPPLKKMGWKRESFIFDALPFGNVSALCFEKKSCYNPLKTRASIPICEQFLLTGR